MAENCTLNMQKLYYGCNAKMVNEHGKKQKKKTKKLKNSLNTKRKWPQICSYMIGDDTTEL